MSESPYPAGPSARLMSPDLVQFARSQVGEYPDRYRAILRRAFAAHTLVLNAKQLRELAGGGSQTTAQRAIDEFRADLAAKLSNRLRLGAGVPESLVQDATHLIEALWALAREQAAQQFDEERNAFQTKADLAHARIAELQLAREQLGQRLSESEQALALAREEIGRLNDDLGALTSQLEAERRARVEDQARHEAVLLEVQTSSKGVQDQLQQHLSQACLHRDHALQTLEAERRDAGHRFDRLLVEHREALGAARREADERSSRQQRELHSLRERLETAVARAVSAERAENAGIEALQGLQRTELDLRSRLSELQQELQQAREAAAAAQQRLIDAALRRSRTHPR